MPSEQKELSAEEVQALLAMPQTQRRGGSTKKPLTDDRTIPGWFKLPHSFTEGTDCNVPAHDETPRIENGPPDSTKDPISRKRTTTKIGDLYVCRYCYVEERDKLG